MFRTRGKLPLILLAILAILMLSGCQELLQQIPFLQPTQAPQPTATVTSVSPEVNPTELPVPLEEQPLEITIWLPPQFDPDNGTIAGILMKNQLNRFTEENPRITVKVRLKAVEGSGGLLDSLFTASAAAPGAVPGLILLPRRDFEIAAEAGLLLPVEPVDVQMEDSDYFPFALDLARVKDIRYGLPFSGDLLVVGYNALQIGFPPQLWTSVYQQKSIVAIPGAEPFGLLASVYYLNNGGTFTENEGQLVLTESALLNALEVIHDGVQAGVIPYWTADLTSFEQSYQALQDSKSTYAVIWASQQLSDQAGKNTISALPAEMEGSFTLADGWVLAFPQASSDKLPEYFKLASFLVQPEFQQSWTEAAGVVPVSRSALTQWKDTKVSGILVEIAEKAKLIPGNKVNAIIGPLFSQATQELIRQQVSTIEAANRIKEELLK